MILHSQIGLQSVNNVFSFHCIVNVQEAMPLLQHITKYSATIKNYLPVNRSEMPSSCKSARSVSNCESVRIKSCDDIMRTDQHTVRETNEANRSKSLYLEALAAWNQPIACLYFEIVDGFSGWVTIITVTCWHASSSAAARSREQRPDNSKLSIAGTNDFLYVFRHASSYQHAVRTVQQTPAGIDFWHCQANACTCQLL
jgi:hypothetical protein